MTWNNDVSADDWAERGRRIVADGKYTPPLGKYLGRIDTWGIDVFEGSPRQWIDTLAAEAREQGWL